ncbi:MAG TPA: VOC family protein [Trebonia sp.]|jgi:methylmalonyl-CoA/ethylmalonyl-CoA epimerase|nr:VOC family protein [Trebonia sp.]
MLQRIDHVGIACRSLEAAIEKYTSVFGLSVTSLEVNEEQGVKEAMLALGETIPLLAPDQTAGGLAPPGPAGPLGSYVQLLEPLSADTPVGKFLARRGEGIHHIGYAVANVTDALAAIEAGGLVRLIDARPRHGSLGASIAFLHPADLGGVLTELVQPFTGGPIPGDASD